MPSEGRWLLLLWLALCAVLTPAMRASAQDAGGTADPGAEDGTADPGAEDAEEPDEPPAVEAPDTGDSSTVVVPGAPEASDSSDAGSGAVEAPEAGTVEPSDSADPGADEADSSAGAEAPVEPASDPQSIEDLDLEALLSGRFVSGVSRIVESADDSAAVVTVVTREQIRRWGYRSIAEILRRMAGFYVVDDHILPNVAVRGVSGGLAAESGLIRVMIDGQHVVYRPTGGSWLGPELIPMSLVERIEIIRGPGSTVYGPDAFLGVINIVTRDPERVSGGEILVEGSYLGGLGGGVEATMGHREGAFSFLSSLRLHSEDRSGLRLPESSPDPSIPPYRLRDPSTGLDARGLTQASMVGFARATWHIGTNSHLRLTLWASRLDRGAELAHWAQLSRGYDFAGRSRFNHVSLWQGYLSLELELDLSHEVHLSANVRGFMGEPTSDDHIDVGSQSFFLRRQSGFRGLDVAASVRWTPIDALQLVLGADLVLDDEQLPGITQIALTSVGAIPGEPIPSRSFLQPRRMLVNLGVYALGRLNIDDRLVLHGGARYDYHNIYGHQLNGRLGATLTIIEGLSTKLIWGSAFRAPNTLLLFGVPATSGDIVGNQALNPQQIHTFEWQGTVELVEWLRVETGLSYSILFNKAEFTPVDGNLIARNVAAQDALSWDTSVRFEWEEQLRMYATVSVVTGSRDLSLEGYRRELFGSGLDVYPPVTVFAGASYAFVDIPLSLSTEIQYLAPRPASDANVIARGRPYELPDAFYWDAAISIRPTLVPGHTTQLSLTVRNILDTRAAHPGFSGIDYPSTQRAWMLTWIQEL